MRKRVRPLRFPLATLPGTQPETHRMNKDHLDNLEAEILNGLAEIESLEARKTPALVGPGTLFGGILTLNFDGGNDTIDVSQNADTLTVAYNDGTHHDTLTFAA